MCQRSKPATVFIAVASKELYKSSRRFVPSDAFASIGFPAGAGGAQGAALVAARGVFAGSAFAGVTVSAFFSTASCSGDSEEYEEYYSVCFVLASRYKKEIG